MVYAVFVFAFLARLLSLMFAGGFDSILGYDDGVYFGASAAFVHGLIPYKDFVLVHPPGILLILAPFTWISKLTSDSFAFYAARIFFMLIGATSTALIYVIAKRFNKPAALIAATIYAVWNPVVRVERTAYLEGIGSLALLVALYLIPKAKTSKIQISFAGLALGIAVSTKLWFAVPVVIIFAWLVLNKEFLRALIFGSVSFGTFLSIIAWFWYQAGSRFWELIITAQIHRANFQLPLRTRIDQIFNFTSLTFLHNSNLRFVVGVAIVTLLTIPFIRFFKKHDQGILILFLFAAQFVVLLQTPVFFNAYPSFVAATLALIAGITLGEFHRNIITGLVIASFITISFHSTLTQEPGRDLPTKIEQLPLQKSRCVTSDDPVLLALTNTLTKDLQNNCHLIFDVTGVIYGINSTNSQDMPSKQRRLKSDLYQRQIEKYLSSGSVVILGRPKHDGLRPKTIQELDRNREVTETKSFVIIQ